MSSLLRHRKIRGWFAYFEDPIIVRNLLQDKIASLEPT